MGHKTIQVDAPRRAVFTTQREAWSLADQDREARASECTIAQIDAHLRDPGGKTAVILVFPSGSYTLWREDEYVWFNHAQSSGSESDDVTDSLEHALIKILREVT